MNTTPPLFPCSEPAPCKQVTIFEQWAALGKEYAKQHGNLQWKIGDWLVFGQRAYGETAYAEAEKITGKKRQTLYQFASVAKRVPDCMRHTSLSWEHHQVVASLEPEDQKAWLDAAKEKNINAKQLRRAVGGGASPPKAGLPPPQMPVDWKFYKLPLHVEDFENLEALASARSVQPGSLGTKPIPPPVRLAHQIILEYMVAHAKELEDARFRLAHKRLGTKPRRKN
jgi:hypothetical protein